MATRSKHMVQRLFDLFVTALEGGIGYWSVCKTYHWTKQPGAEKLPVDKAQDLYGFYAVVVETDPSEGDTPKTHRIDAAVLSLGLRRLREGKVTFGNAPWDAVVQRNLWHQCHDEDGNYDAGDADIVVQAGLFGDIIFG